MSNKACDGELGRDRISELPADLLDKIMGFLPIEEAARCSILSTVWRDIWRGLSQLHFDTQFFDENYFLIENDISSWQVIKEILMKQHKGPIRKFESARFPDAMDCVESDDWDECFILLTQNGVEEISIFDDPDPCPYDWPELFTLPNCFFSCSTLKILRLSLVQFEPINTRTIFPNLTRLDLQYVDFVPKKALDCVPCAPMLQNMSLCNCTGLFYLIKAPKLTSLKVTSFDGESMGGLLLVNLDLAYTCSLALNGPSLKNFVHKYAIMGLQLQPTAAVLESLELRKLDLVDANQISAFLSLLRIYPNLCTLHISLRVNTELMPRCLNNVSKLLEGFHNMTQTQKTLKVLKIIKFKGSKPEILFVEGVLAIFSALENVAIICKKGVHDAKITFSTNAKVTIRF